MNRRYRYTESLKSSVSDEWINTYLIRPLAGLVVWPLYYTRVTPNQLTIASTVAGVAAAYMYLGATPRCVALAGLLVTLKDILDSADGQLARAKQLYSRSGRFLDSLSDAFVNLLLFSAIGYVLYQQSGSWYVLPLALLALLSTTLRISYHVYYHTAFLHLSRKYDVNRLIEEIREEDLQAGRSTLLLQQVFQVIYGWQDKLVARIDRWCSGELHASDQAFWYGNRTALQLSGLMGMGTEMAVLTVFSLLNRLESYLIVNVVAGNAVALCAILYRRFAARRRLRQGRQVDR